MTAQARTPNHIFGPGRAVNQMVENERRGKRNHSEINIAYAAIDHENAKQRRERHWHQDARQHRNRAFAEIDHSESIGIPAKTKEGRLPKRQDAGESPHEGKAERQDRKDAVDAEVDKREQLHQIGNHDQRRDARCRDGSNHDQLCVEFQTPPRNNRPVMPAGSKRSNTMAAASSATSPTTGVAKKVMTWLTVPSNIAAEAVPARTVAPPLMTVIKALAIYVVPITGTTPEIGASIPPARPESAAPSPKVAA